MLTENDKCKILDRLESIENCIEFRSSIYQDNNTDEFRSYARIWERESKAMIREAVMKVIGEVPKSCDNRTATDTSHQSDEVACLRHDLRRLLQVCDAIDRQRQNLFYVVLRILRVAPQYRLRPSELAAESVGSLSFLPQGTVAGLYNRMMKDSPAQTSREDSGRATPCQDHP